MSVATVRYLYKLTPVPRKSTFRYNYVQFHSGVVLFFVNFRVRVRVSYRLRVRDRYLKHFIGGAAGTVDIPVR